MRTFGHAVTRSTKRNETPTEDPGGNGRGVVNGYTLLPAQSLW